MRRSSKPSCKALFTHMMDGWNSGKPAAVHSTTSMLVGPKPTQTPIVKVPACTHEGAQSHAHACPGNLSAYKPICVWTVWLFVRFICLCSFLVSLCCLLQHVLSNPCLSVPLFPFQTLVDDFSFMSFPSLMYTHSTHMTHMTHTHRDREIAEECIWRSWTRSKALQANGRFAGLISGKMTGVSRTSLSNL